MLGSYSNRRNVRDRLTSNLEDVGTADERLARELQDPLRMLLPGARSVDRLGKRVWGVW